MDAAPVSDDVSTVARVHARVVIVVVVVVFVVVVFWRASIPQRHIFFPRVEARNLCRRSRANGNRGFVCICKPVYVYLREPPGIVPGRSYTGTMDHSSGWVQRRELGGNARSRTRARAGLASRGRA